MRDDMDKVIVERPRGGGGVQGDGRSFRNSRERGSHLGMKRGYGHPKWLSENLAPLRRWLHKQVHRPRSKVYAELNSGIDRRSTRLAQARAARKADRRAWAEQRGGGIPCAVHHVIDEVTQWHRVEGCWFEITLAKFPERAGASR